MQKHDKYLIHAFNDSDCYLAYDEGTQYVRFHTQPVGAMQKNECSCVVYTKDTEIPYHEHQHGFETFILTNGSAECVVRGKRFVLEKGDILHLMPYVAHSFKHLEDGNVWREFFQEMDMVGGIMNKNVVKGNYDGLYDDPEFIKMYRAANRSILRETPVAEDVDKRSLPEVRTPDFAFSTFRLDGAELRLKVGRWECNGVKEVWEAVMDKGFTVEYDDPYPEWELYWVMGGKVRFKVLDQEFDAVQDCIVRIPPYHKHSFAAVEDGSVMLDIGCPMLLLDLLEDLESVRANAPEKLQDQKFMKAFKERKNCYVTFAGKK